MSNKSVYMTLQLARLLNEKRASAASDAAASIGDSAKNSFSSAANSIKGKLGAIGNSISDYANSPAGQSALKGLMLGAGAGAIAGALDPLERKNRLKRILLMSLMGAGVGGGIGAYTGTKKASFEKEAQFSAARESLKYLFANTGKSLKNLFPQRFRELLSGGRLHGFVNTKKTLTDQLAKMKLGKNGLPLNQAALQARMNGAAYRNAASQLKSVNSKIGPEALKVMGTRLGVGGGLAGVGALGYNAINNDY